MTPRAMAHAERIAAERYMNVRRIADTTSREHAVTQARWELWRRLAADGLTVVQVASETGHNRASVIYALAKMGIRDAPKFITYRKTKIKLPPPNPEGLAIVEANIAAMQAKHRRELESRY